MQFEIIRNQGASGEYFKELMPVDVSKLTFT
jgi:hypothetical protein